MSVSLPCRCRSDRFPCPARRGRRRRSDSWARSGRGGVERPPHRQHREPGGAPVDRDLASASWCNTLAAFTNPTRSECSLGITLTAVRRVVTSPRFSAVRSAATNGRSDGINRHHERRWCEQPLVVLRLLVSAFRAVWELFRERSSHRPSDSYTSVAWPTHFL